MPAMETTMGIITGMDTTTTIMSEPASALALFVWLSPAFPVGGFAYSHGLEWAVEAGDIRRAADLAVWLDDLLDHGAIRADAVLMALAWRTQDLDALIELNDLALALAPSRERALETGAQGTAFLTAVGAAWPAPGILTLIDRLGDQDAAYPVAIGVASAAHKIPLRATLEAFGLAAIGNLVSAVLRLGPIGQTDAQAIIAKLMPKVAAVAAWAERAGLNDLGTCAWRSDIAAMQHETQYSRLFRS